MPKISAFLAYVPVLLVCPVGAGSHAQQRDTTCVFTQATATEFSGFCELPDRRVKANLTRPETGHRWIGRMEGRHPEDPTEFEVIGSRADAMGVAKTPFGWFPLKSFTLSAGILTMTFSTQKQVAPTAADIRIINRTLDILADESKWNKRDDRNCPSGAEKWSVFCALLQATGEVVGSVHYRQPALQAVRQVLNEVGGTRITKHRLMDYNNHPDTTIQDIRNLLRTAAGRIESQFRDRS